MEKRAWNKESIENDSTLNEGAKKILLDELAHKKDGLTMFSRDDDVALSDFKKQYKNSLKSLKRYSYDTYKFITNLYKNCLTDTPDYIAKPSFDVTEEYIISTLNDFYNYLKDEEFIKAFNEILHDPKNFINIETHSDDNEAIEYFNGRCINPVGTNDTYISIYTTNSFNDLTLTAHELGHAIEHRLYNDSNHPFTSMYLKEFSSYYFELLMSNYINEGLKYSTAALMLEAKRTNETIDAAWKIKAQDILYHQRHYDASKINEELIKLGRKSYFEQDEMKYLTKFTFNYNNMLVESYMLAVEVYYKTLEDPEKGIRIYKAIMQDPEFRTKTILDKYDVNYLEDNSKFESMKAKSKGLIKILNK